MWARFVSVIFHPLLMPTYLFLVLAWAMPAALEPIGQAQQLEFIGFVFIVTFLLPFLNVGIFRVFGTVRSFSMLDRRERVIPFIFISLLYVAITYLFYFNTHMDLNDNFFKLMVVIDLLVVVATISTFFFKVSVHSISAWGLIGMLVPLHKMSEVETLFYPTLCVILLAGLIMSARLKVGAHTSREVMWGGVLGLGTSVLGMVLLF